MAQFPGRERGELPDEDFFIMPEFLSRWRTKPVFSDNPEIKPRFSVRFCIGLVSPVTAERPPFFGPCLSPSIIAHFLEVRDMTVTASASNFHWFWISVLVAACSIPLAHGDVITFETTPSGIAPVDDAALSRFDNYVIDGLGVSFGFDSNGDGSADTDAVFERRGDDTNNGFFSAFGPTTFDSERGGSSRSLGQFFLRQPSSLGELPGVFVISYDTAVTGLSGEIWDIDAGVSGFEQWRVSSFDGSGSLLSSVDSPIGIDTNDINSLDSLAWIFSLEGAGIRRVEIEFIGTSSVVGLAFNNYNATSVPEPSSCMIFSLALGFCAVVASRRRRKQIAP